MKKLNYYEISKKEILTLDWKPVCQGFGKKEMEAKCSGLNKSDPQCIYKLDKIALIGVNKNKDITILWKAPNVEVKM